MAAPRFDHFLARVWLSRQPVGGGVGRQLGCRRATFFSPQTHGRMASCSIGSTLIAGAVGIAGIGGTILAARMTNKGTTANLVKTHKADVTFHISDRYGEPVLVETRCRICRKLLDEVEARLLQRNCGPPGKTSRFASATAKVQATGTSASGRSGSGEPARILTGCRPGGGFSGPSCAPRWSAPGPQGAPACT